MRVLVTGGAGFIGKHLCRALLEQGDEVLCLDNLYSSTRSDLQPFVSDTNFEFVRHDVIEPILLEVDRIYNLACPASPGHYQFNPVKTVKTSVMGTLNMLGLAKRVRARVLQASTSEIYGDPRVHPQAEDYWGYVNTVGPRSCYDEGKRVAETLMMDYHRQNGVDVRIPRIFNTYGPGMTLDDGRVVSNLVVQALRGEPMTLYGDGMQTRSFCYVSDMVAGLMRLMEADGDEACQPLNLGNPVEVSIRDLAEKIRVATGTGSRIVERPLPEDDPIRRQPDISRARELLGWEPVVELDDGLRLTIDFFRSRLENPG